MATTSSLSVLQGRQGPLNSNKDLPATLQQDGQPGVPQTEDHRRSAHPLWNSTLLQRNWLIASPYTEQRHQLDLNTLETQDQLMAIALTTLLASGSDYATSRYEDAFDWQSLFQTLKSLAKSEGVRWERREYYVVEFRSKVKEQIDVDLLYRLDKESHGEAAQSGGLLKYWYGKPDGERRNLATCLWRNKDDAIKGGRGPWHKQAREVIPRMYEEIWVKGLRLVVAEDVRDWQFSPYA